MSKNRQNTQVNRNTSNLYSAARYSNFARVHKTLANPYPRTPAMVAGISDHIWTIEEIVKLLD